MMPQVEHNALVGAEQLASDVLEILERLFPARKVLSAPRARVLRASGGNGA